MMFSQRMFPLIALALTACTEVGLNEFESEGDDVGECSDGADNDRDAL